MTTVGRAVLVSNDLAAKTGSKKQPLEIGKRKCRSDRHSNSAK